MLQKDIANYTSYWLDMNAVYARLAKEHQLTVSMLYLYLGLANHDYAASPQELGNYTQLSKQTITSMLGVLEKAGKIERTRNELDKRKRLVRPTALGLSEITHVLSEVKALEEQAFSALSDQERQLLNQLSQKLLNGFQDVFSR